MTTHHSGFGSLGTDTLEKSLWESAHWIWDRRRAAKLAGFPFSEETVTETVLLDLASTLSHLVKIVPFNKSQEGKIGADWEWCFYDFNNSRFLRFMVQAKVLDDKDKAYAHIDRYIGNTDVRQIDRLGETSLSRGVPAIYVFYNHLSDTSRIPIKACPCAECYECWGATFAPHSAISALLPDKKFDTIRHVSLPWLCLVCATSSGSGSNLVGAPGGEPDLIDAVLTGFSRANTLCRDYFSSKLEAPRFLLPSISDVAPNYLRPLIESASDSDFSDRLLEKFRSENPGVDGVVIIPADLDREVSDDPF